MWYIVVFQPFKCRNTNSQPQIWSIWPILPIDSESLPKVCYINWKNSENLSKLRNSEPGGASGPHRLRNSGFTQIFWVFLVYIADFWQTFWVIWENGSNWSNLRLKMSFFALGRLKNHKVPHLHPNSTMFMPLDRLQLKIYAFSGKFNVCSKRVLLSWIKICRDFTLQTQIFTQKYRSWLRFYSEFLRKKLAAGGSGGNLNRPQHTCPGRRSAQAAS